MAAIVPFLPLISGALGVVSAISQGNAAQDQAKSEQNAALYNRQVDENNAKAVNAQTSAREDMLRRNRRIELGKQSAAISQSGLTDTGSVLDMFDQSAVDSELNILNQRYEGNARAKGFNDQATLDQYSADGAKARGKNAKSAMMLGIAGSVLKAGSSYFGASSSGGLTQSQQLDNKSAGILSKY